MKLILKSSITHDQIEYHPGLHDIPDNLAEKWLKELPDQVRVTTREDNPTPGKKIDLKTAMGSGPLHGTEIK